MENAEISDYDEILRKIGNFGRYQKVFLLVVASSAAFNAMTSFALNFAYGEHAHRCKVNEMDNFYSPPGEIFWNNSNGEEAFNVSECSIEVNGTYQHCDRWLYDKSLFTNTIISKFDLVCEEKFYRAHFLMAHYIGLLVGSISGGFLSDTLGRKPVLGIGVSMLLLSMGLRPFIPVLWLVTLLEFVNGYGTVVAYISPFILLTEMVGPKQRALANFFIYISFCVGNYILLALAYFFRGWRHLFWAITIPVAGFLIVMFFISESPRWLISRGRKKEAIQILEKMASLNGKAISIDPDEIAVQNLEQTTFKDFLHEVLKSKTLMFRVALMSLNWFAVNLTYYGISMNVAKFSGNIFVNFALASSAETFAIILATLTTEKFGRKYYFCITMIISGVNCICSIFTTTYAGASLSWLTTVLAMLGKFFTGVTFFIIYMYPAELFPTVLRATVLGVCSMAGRVGSISSAYIGELGSVLNTQFGIALPLTIMGTVGLIAGLLTLCLPETKNISLPESVKDAIQIKADDITNESIELDAMTHHA